MAETIRILRVIARLNVGGPAIHVSLATAGLRSRGYDTRLLAGSVGPGEGDMSYVARARGVDVEHVDGLGREIRPGADLRALSHLGRALREHRPHVLHTHTAKAGTLGRIAARFYRPAAGAPRLRVVHTFHGHVLQGYFGAAKNAVFRFVERRLAARTDRLVVPSQRIADELLALGVGRREKYAVVPLGFDLAPFLAVGPRDPSAPHPFRASLGIPADASAIGIVGRLTAVKNHRMFIQAASRLPRRTRTPLHFVLVGDGELRADLEAFARTKGLADVVHFAGWQKDLAAVYRELDVVALTSVNEGTPVSLIEAMASGRAVVSTGVGGVPDVVKDGETGLLVSVTRDDLFAVAMGRLADDAELRGRLAAAAREDAAKRFGVDRLLDDLDSLYRSLVTAGIGVPSSSR